MNPLERLEACGRSPWLDYRKRCLIARGDWHDMLERDGLKGVTSNPRIFEKAIAGANEYADALRWLLASGDHGVSRIYEHRVIAGIRGAADVIGRTPESFCKSTAPIASTSTCRASATALAPSTRRRRYAATSRC